jgi:hypothetical protein
MEMKKQLLVGLPGAGKTTFLAALWQVVESEEVPGSLVVSEVHGIRDHLNKIRETWVKCQPFERTRIPAEKMVSFRLKHPQSGDIVELALPDLSGETFKLQWEKHEWTSDFEKLASESSGVLLFIHPSTIEEPVRIDPTLDCLAATLDNGDVGAKASDSESSPQKEQSFPSAIVEEWTPEKTPAQVKLVEILQFLRFRPFADRILPVAVVVSAWDLIADGNNATSWLEKRLPLFAQFLQANREEIPSAVFGISAQGGELSKAAQLQHHINASNRIIVSAPDRSTTHDITAPIKWLLER